MGSEGNLGGLAETLALFGQDESIPCLRPVSDQCVQIKASAFPNPLGVDGGAFEVS